MEVSIGTCIRSCLLNGPPRSSCLVLTFWMQPTSRSICNHDLPFFVKKPLRRSLVLLLYTNNSNNSLCSKLCPTDTVLFWITRSSFFWSLSLTTKHPFPSHLIQSLCTWSVADMIKTALLGSLLVSLVTCGSLGTEFQGIQHRQPLLTIFLIAYTGCAGDCLERLTSDYAVDLSILCRNLTQQTVRLSILFAKYD